MDTVFIEQLAVKTTIGVYEWEKKIKQKLVLDIKMQHDCEPAAINDDIKLALDYFEVANTVTNYISNGQFELIEKVADDVAKTILIKFLVKEVTVTVRKPGAVSNAAAVGVTITRSSKVSSAPV